MELLWGRQLSISLYCLPLTALNFPPLPHSISSLGILHSSLWLLYFLSTLEVVPVLNSSPITHFEWTMYSRGRLWWIRGICTHYSFCQKEYFLPDILMTNFSSLWVIVQVWLSQWGLSWRFYLKLQPLYLSRHSDYAHLNLLPKAIITS